MDNLTFEGGSSWKILSMQEIFCPMINKANSFFQSKAVHDIELSKYYFSLIWGAGCRKFFSKSTNPHPLPQNSNDPPLNAQRDYKTQNETVNLGRLWFVTIISVQSNRPSFQLSTFLSCKPSQNLWWTSIALRSNFESITGQHSSKEYEIGRSK